MDIVEFLRTRLDEDEAVARAAADPLPWLVYSGFGDDGGGEVTVGPARMRYSDDEPAAEHIARHQPARVLREVEAERRIVDWCVAEGRWYMGPVVYLAAVYAEHPDYRPEWTP